MIALRCVKQIGPMIPMIKFQFIPVRAHSTDQGSRQILFGQGVVKLHAWRYMVRSNLWCSLRAPPLQCAVEVDDNRQRNKCCTGQKCQKTWLQQWCDCNNCNLQALEKQKPSTLDLLRLGVYLNVQLPTSKPSKSTWFGSPLCQSNRSALSHQWKSRCRSRSLPKTMGWW